MLEMTDALKQTLPTCASRNIRKTVWRIYISIVDLKSLRTCFYPTGLFKQLVNDRTVLVPVNEGITYIFLFLELEEADFLRHFPLRAMVTARVNLYCVQRKILLSPKTFRNVFVLI